MHRYRYCECLVVLCSRTHHLRMEKPLQAHADDFRAQEVLASGIRSSSVFGLSRNVLRQSQLLNVQITAEARRAYLGKAARLSRAAEPADDFVVLALDSNMLAESARNLSTVGLVFASPSRLCARLKPKPLLGRKMTYRVRECNIHEYITWPCRRRLQC